MSLSAEFQRFPPHWTVLPFTDAVKDATSGNVKLKKEEYLETGSVPIVDQGQALYGGYTDNKDLVCKSELPTIVFGDHTRAFKFIDEPFALGADGAKVLEPIAELDKRFLFHYLKQLRIESAGYSRHYKFLKESYVPVPPLSEQKRIAAILDKADAICRKRQQAIQLADDFLRSVFLDMFGDPVTNPKGWEVRPLLESISHANNGLSRRRKEPENVGQIVLRLQDVHYDGIRLEKDLNRIRLKDSEKQRFLVNQGDILFIRVNGNPDYVGRSAVFEGFEEDVYHNDHLIRIKVGDAYDPVFLSYCFNHAAGRKIISGQIKTSAGQHTISQAGIGALEFYMPPLAIQKKFICIRNAVVNISFAGDAPSDLFASLSQQAFSGQL